MHLIAFEPRHLRLIRPQAEQADGLPEAPSDMAWTAVHDGVPLCCGGLIEVWPGRAYAWALLDRDVGPHMLALTREIRSLLAAAPFRRIEMAVKEHFEPGRRWAELLGFRLEVLAMRYMPDGGNALIYVRFA